MNTAARHEAVLGCGDRNTRSLGTTQFPTQDGYSFVTNAALRKPPWALGIARMQVLSFRRDHQRDRHVFDDQVLEQLASEYAAVPDDPDDRQRAFENCFEQLPERQQALLAARYAPGGSVKEVAESRGQSAGALSVTLSRIRKAVANCIQAKLDKAALE